MFTQVYVESTPCDRPHELHCSVVLQHCERNDRHTLVLFSTLSQKTRWYESCGGNSLVDWNGRSPRPVTPSIVLLCKSSLRRFAERCSDWPLGELVLDNVSLVRQKWQECRQPRYLTPDNVSILLNHLQFERRLTIMHTPFICSAPAVGQEDVLELLQTTAFLFAHDIMWFMFRDGAWLMCDGHQDDALAADDDEQELPRKERKFDVLRVGARELWQRLAEWYADEMGGDAQDCELMRLGLGPHTCRLHPQQDAEVSTQLSMIDLASNFARRQACYMKATTLADELLGCCSDDPRLFLRRIPHPQRNFAVKGSSLSQLAQQLELCDNAADLERHALADKSECPVCCDRLLDDDDTALPPVLLSCGHTFCLLCCVRLAADVIVWQNHFWEMVEDEGRSLFRLGAVVCPLCRTNVSKFHAHLTQSQSLLRRQIEQQQPSLADTITGLSRERLWVLVVPFNVRHELDRVFPTAFVDDNNLRRVAPHVLVLELNQAVCLVEQLPDNSVLLALTTGHAEILEDMQTIFERPPLPVMLLQPS